MLPELSRQLHLILSPAAISQRLFLYLSRLRILRLECVSFREELGAKAQL